MVTHHLLYDALIYTYTLSLLFYFSDFARSNQSSKRMGLGLLYVVWILQTIFLVIYWNHYVRDWFFSESTVLFVFSWLLVSSSIVIDRFFRMEFFAFLVNVISFVVCIVHIFVNREVISVEEPWIVHDELWFVQILSLVVSYVALSLSAIFAGMYIFFHHKLKNKQWTPSVKRMPSLETMEKFMFSSVFIGIALFTVAFSFSRISIALHVDGQLLLNANVFQACMVLITYSVYVVGYYSLRITSHQLAIWNLAAYGIAMLYVLIQIG